MNEKILIVEDQFVEANDLRLMLEKAGYGICGIAGSVKKALEIIAAEKPGLVLLDIYLKGRLTGIDLARQLKKDHIGFVYLSANSNEEVLSAAKETEPLGFLLKPFREKDVLVTLEIARYRHEHAKQYGHIHEALLQQQLTALLLDPDSPVRVLLKTIRMLQSHIPFEYMTIRSGLNGQPAQYRSGFLRVGFDEYQTIGPDELMIIMKLNIHQLSALEVSGETVLAPACCNGDEFASLCHASPLHDMVAGTFQLRSYLALPLPLSDGATCYLSFYSRRQHSYHADHISFFTRWLPTLTNVVEKLMPAAMSPSGSGRTSIKNDRAPEHPGFDKIIGKSHLLLHVFDHVSRVAPADTSVLILGESGTGKERIADSIHLLSPRKKNPFIKVNCAAFPSALIESELFGHEKGSFTGAAEKRIGKFEQADGGTLFLDEIGEIPFELQVKLLRVLQEKEIERIGGKGVIKINVRIIAATNRNLEKEVAEGRFRLDLYYRLNVFPIMLPPLRERKEDLPALISHFIGYFNRKTGKKITGISEKVLRSLMDYAWPGNIRELEHLVERSILLARGLVIEEVLLPMPRIPLSQTTSQTQPAPIPTRIKTIHENERDHIIDVLKKCCGRIWGPGGAAELLDVPPTTLASKMKKLGVRRENIA